MFHLRVEIQPAQVVLIELIFREGWVNRAPRCTGSRSTRSHASAAEDERLVLPVRLGGWMSASGDRPALQRRPIILLLAALSINTSEQAAVRSSLGSSATAMATGARRTARERERAKVPPRSRRRTRLGTCRRRGHSRPILAGTSSLARQSAVGRLSPYKAVDGRSGWLVPADQQVIPTHC